MLRLAHLHQPEAVPVSLLVTLAVIGALLVAFVWAVIAGKRRGAKWED